jgi:hypothetical protein
LKIYPATGGAIDDAATNAAITIPNGGTWVGAASSTTQWYTVDPSTVAGTGISVAYGNGNTTVSNTGVLSVSGGTTGLTFDNSTGNVTLQGTLATTNGGTGLTVFAGAGEVFYSATTSTVDQSAAFSFNGTDTLTVGTATIQGAAADVTVTATGGASSNINLNPGSSGAVVVGPVGAGLIQSDPSQPLTVRGNTTLTLTGVTGATLQSTTSGNVAITSAAGVVVTAASGNDITMTLANNTTDKVTVSGPSAADYATSLADSDLVNKYYVDTVAGSAAGDVKAFKQVVSLGADTTTPIGTVLPTGATILSVKVDVTTLNTTSTLEVGISGTPDAYMSATENDPQTPGLYLAECMVVNSAVQIIATVTGQTGGVGSATVVVTYQIAN